MNIMRLVLAVIVCSSIAAPIAASTVPRKSQQRLCKQIHDAVWAGHTLDQLTVEFDTDAAQIMKCVQARKGKKPAPKKAQEKSTAPRHTAKPK